MKLLTYDSPLFSFLNTLADMMVVNLLFIVCCIPIATLSSSYGALYTCAQCWADKKGAGARKFLEIFIKNLKKGVPVSIISAGLIIVMAMDLIFLIGGAYETGTLGKFLLALGLVAVTAVVSHANLMFYRFECGCGAYFFNALLLSLAHPVRTLPISVFHLIPIIMIIASPNGLIAVLPVFLLIYYSITALVAVRIMGSTYSRLVFDTVNSSEDVTDDTTKEKDI